MRIFLYNCQIEIPPTEFIPLVDKKAKEFLWNSKTPKIAHHSIIGEKEMGGLEYKDLQQFVTSMNIKFLNKLNFNKPQNWMALPVGWIHLLFKINNNPNPNNQMEVHEHKLFSDEHFNLCSYET